MNQNQDSSSPGIQAVVFDIGNVLIDWDPKYLFRKLIKDEESIDKFLNEVCTYEWNLQQDKGRLWADATREKIAQFPEHEELIRAYDERWPEMVSSPHHGSVDILHQLKAKMPVYAITNFSREKWDIAQITFPFLNVFDGVTVSADVKMLKPDPAIYEHFLKTFDLTPSGLLFIDDRLENVEAARETGFQAIQFLSSEKLRADLEGLGLL